MHLTNKHKGIANEIIAGLTIFCTISYIAIANPLILKDVGMPMGAVFFATCVASAMGSIWCGLYAKSPTAIAPGMAFNIFLVNYVTKTNWSWSSALLVCFIAGFVLWIISKTNFRTALIRSLPYPIRAAIIGGIGALLADKALSFTRVPNTLQFVPGKVWIFLIGFSVIVVGDIILRRYSENLKKRGLINKTNFFEFLGRASLLISIAICVLIARKMIIPESTDIGHSMKISWLWFSNDVSIISALEGLKNPGVLAFLIFLLYMLIADIAGTPYQLLDKDDEEREEKVRRGFIVDSGMNMIAPIIGTSPVVYYAENNAAKVIGGKSGYVAVTTGISFIIFLMVGCIMSYSKTSLFQIIPQVAIAPALFYIGIRIIAEQISNQTDRIKKGKRKVRSNKNNDSECVVPAALSIVLTPVIGIEYSLAVSLAVYMAFYFTLSPEGFKSKENIYVFILSILALLAIIARLTLV